MRELPKLSHEGFINGKSTQKEVRSQKNYTGKLNSN